MFRRKILELGTSVGITLPPEAQRLLALTIGDTVDLEIVKDKLVVTKVEGDGDAL